MQTNTTHPPRLLRIPDVQHQCGIGRSAIYSRIKAGTFPAPVKLGSRVAVWPASVIDAWIAQQIAASKASA
ncbi:MAG: AlpA family transcriptional regulator [Zoogloea oleivorans]|jgi:prophage regulatory protein|uniref:helix-turn-helix transcriptional regulator n=1 Tax=Zoogloea oleivorans TaxID=1552750 RepID=UPI002A366B9A|nr:AlpA family transcriptional regulator [Zoogloea oleivorans]MDY0035071.1 AlpA family transcriptional regulator [Zoogloea oleivorans]